MNRSDFGADFVWGVASSAAQTEGAADKYGKGPSIWDEFCRQRELQFGSHHINKANDFYHSYADDLDLMRQMHIRHFRYSLSWPRILPYGTGHINRRGIQFYNDLIDCCLENQIQPWFTIYHWDLPLALEKKGGWSNRDILKAFEEYVHLCARHFGDRVKNWMVLNEPMGFTGAGYFLGLHAPGKKGLSHFLPAAHHANLAQHLGGSILRAEIGGAEIGTTYSFSHLEPITENRSNRKAVQKTDALLNRMFLEPTLGLGYPSSSFPLLDRMQEFFVNGDEQNMAFPFDFIGVQVYTREVIKHSWTTPILKAKIVDAHRRKVPVTTMNWEVYPESIYHVLKKVAAYPGVKKIIVTENGAAFPDKLIGKQVEDNERQIYLQKHMQQVLRAKQEGVPVDGYFVWTFTDNFEWAAGLGQRFGLVYVDYDTQKRYVKKSGHWYARFLLDR